MKVWNIKKFNCVQQINLDSGEEKHKFNPQALTYIKRPLKLVVVGRTISIYEYDKNFNPHSADEYVATCAKFVKASLSILTPVGNKVKVWNALTGDLKKIYSDII